MSDNPVLEHLRHMRGGLDALCEDMRDVKHRLTGRELQVSNLAATEASHYAGVALRLDRIEDRLDRVERRLDVVPAL